MFARGRDKVLIADEMGLGKTVQAIGVINDNPEFWNILIICPASLRLNWERELGVWLLNKDLSIEISRSKVSKMEANIVIVNYDILSKVPIRSRDWDLIIIDEAHYIKNNKAKRTREICGFRSLPPLTAKKTVMLTGTPMTNRPEDLWTICHYMDPGTFLQQWAYLHRYCDPKMRFGRWDFSGASNLEELKSKMSNWTIRRYKKDVLPELPDKQYQVVELNPVGQQLNLIKDELKMTEFVENTNRVVVKFSDTSEIRRELGEKKARTVIKRLEDMMEETDQKMVVFAHHRSVIEEIAEHFGIGAVRVYGGMSTKAKQESIDKFNNDSSVRLFVGSITSAGVGITLTAASILVFAEMSYVPAEMQQAEDRIHRVGQEADSVNIMYMVYRNSLDANIAYRLVEKQNVIDQVLSSYKYVTFGDDGKIISAEN